MDTPSRDTVSTDRVSKDRSGFLDSAEVTMHQVYPVIVKEVYSGKSVSKAIQSSRVTLAVFGKYRYIIEMKILDASHYESLRQEFERNTTKLSVECKRCLTEKDSPYFQRAQRKRADKEFLPLY